MTKISKISLDLHTNHHHKYVSKQSNWDEGDDKLIIEQHLLRDPYVRYKGLPSPFQSRLEE